MMKLWVANEIVNYNWISCDIGDFRVWRGVKKNWEFAGLCCSK
jgi:hypothetical protein